MIILEQSVLHMYRIYLTLILLFSFSAWGQPYLVLSSTDSSVVEKIDVEDLRDIFLGNRIFWRNGSRIYSAHVPKETKTMKRFLKKVLSMSPSQYNKYWRRKLFSGKGHPPMEIESEKLAYEYIMKTNGSLGIVQHLPKRRPKNLFFFRPASDGKTLDLIN